jgi:hypothetical protein
VLRVLATRFDQELQLLQTLGLSAGEAASLHNVLYGPTVGFVLMQLGAVGGEDEPTAVEALEEAVERLDPAEFPTLKAVNDLEALVALDDDTFEDVLSLLIAGMRSEYAGAAKPAKPARPKAASRNNRRAPTRGQGNGRRSR